jgi:membrane-bound lytic murein transglycosylase MltF
LYFDYKDAGKLEPEEIVEKKAENENKSKSVNTAQTKGQKESRRSGQYDTTIMNLSLKNGVDPFLVKSIIQAESSFIPNLTSPRGAKGLMQIMPQTWKDMGGATGMELDPYENISVGTRYLRTLFNQLFYPQIVVAAYNGGITRICSIVVYGEIRIFSSTPEAMKVINDASAKLYKMYQQDSKKDMTEYTNKMYDETQKYLANVSSGYRKFTRKAGSQQSIVVASGYKHVSSLG